MNVSIWMMLLWVVLCVLMMYDLKMKLFPTKESLKLKGSEKETAVGVTIILSLLLAFFNIIYFISSANMVENIFFTLISAILIVIRITSTWKTLAWLGQYMNEQLPPEKIKNNYVNITLKIIHLAYFGYFIFF